jgi:dihydrofolate synthase/folylpolyglutamate synthase
VSERSERTDSTTTGLADVVRYLEVDLFQSPDGLFREGDGFARSQALMAALGDPQDAVAAVHVAGTAGKGTVATAIADAASGPLRVGLHVSPHVYDLRERFTVDGELATEDEVVALLDQVRPIIAAMAAGPHGPPTSYEVSLAMALLHFRGRGCDLMVVETGLGGLYDTTNTIGRDDKLAVVVRIAHDHEAVLGPTLTEIARQKAGILTRGGEAVVLRPEDPAVEAVVADEARDRDCRIRWVEPGGRTGAIAHRAEDGAVATAALEILGARTGLDLAGRSRPLEALALPGRYERVPLAGGGEALLDGAHTPLKLAAFVDRLHRTHGSARRPWVFGCKPDKKARAMLGVVLAEASRLCVVGFPIRGGDVPAGPSTDPAELAAIAADLAPAVPVTVAPDPAAAAAFMADVTTDDAVPVVGSFYLLSALRPLLTTL